MGLLSEGSRGQEVINLQEALNYQLPEALPRLAVDRIFGPKTKARTKEFQTIRGLAADGIVGPKTSAALYNFVQSRMHIIVPPARSIELGTRRSLNGVGDSPTDPILPPIPKLTLPFPTPFRPPPPNIFPLPPLTLGGGSTNFELAAGLQRTIGKSLTNNTRENTVSVFTDVSFTIWRRPIGKFVELKAGPGVFLERELRPDEKSTVRVGMLVTAELKDVVKIGPLDLFKLIVEHKTTTTATGPIELSSELEVGFNPTVEVNIFGNKIEFGPKISKYFEIGIGKEGFNLKSGSTLTAGTLTFFF